MLTYMLWAVFVWLSITYASLIYRMLDPGTEDQLVKTWLVSIGLNQVSDLQSAAITLVEVTRFSCSLMSSRRCGSAVGSKSASTS